MASTWYVAPSLEQLRTELNTRWSGRDRTSDGGVGDTAHSARISDHNPARPPDPSPGVVRARDYDEDGIPTDLLLREAITDPRVNYVIYERLIYTRANGFAPKAYTGVNPHDKHMHISIRHGKQYEDDRTPWINDVTLTAHTTPTPGVDIPAVTGTLPAPLEDDMADYAAQLNRIEEALVIKGAPYQVPEAILAAVQELAQVVKTIQQQNDATLAYLRVGEGGELAPGMLDHIARQNAAIEMRLTALQAALENGAHA